METITKPIDINVGGRIFTTTVTTLCGCGFFSAFFSNTKNSESIFIDRDPDGFVHVLRRLRNPKYVIPKEWEEEWYFFNPSSIDVSKSDSGMRKLGPEDGDKMYVFMNMNDLAKRMGVKYIEWIVTLDPVLSSDGSTIFDLPDVADEIVHPLFDYTIVHGEVRMGSFRMVFGGNKPFYPIYNLFVFYVRKQIIIYSKLDQLRLVIRTYTSEFKEKAMKKRGLFDAEHDIVYSELVHSYNGIIMPWTDPESVITKVESMCRKGTNIE